VVMHDDDGTVHSLFFGRSAIPGSLLRAAFRLLSGFSQSITAILSDVFRHPVQGASGAAYGKVPIAGVPKKR
jgi:hypothetical protein